MRENKFNNSFWPSYVDVMTTLFAIMLVLFAVSYNRFRIKEAELRKFADKYKEISSIYQAVENIDTTYFEFNPTYVKHIFKIQVTFQTEEFSLYKLVGDAPNGNKADAENMRRHIINAGEEIKRTIKQLQNNDSIIGGMKYLVVIEGQASADGYNIDNCHNNDVLSYQRALELNKFWKSAGIDFSDMKGCELVVSGSGEKGVPRDIIEKNNQRFLIHIVPVIGNIRLKK